ncbi:MAG: hypothetical protein US54_C0042G0002 [Candidatus Roizmanbacteria bacterium GW2011_GWA2_37_7]|uniref:Nudix hydrolase domain-containing protein n=1 Tax=Candidatus Roizmanbacteria bacterium GW2011_GWA2_37_7 TaxID=1618481 RepID=A0A0G0H1R5_9BACT|nr:MAG: hypothetical protein US54_C0042G0002 [Candidatus Roizmanbacteria bacterium GW2011_GWA2_37_7]
MQHYDDVRYIATVDTKDEVQGKIERWEAHTKGILHRALTLAVFVKDTVLLQHRKHPVFDSVYDMTISTHQQYKDSTLQTDEEAMYQTLKRELLLAPSSLKQIPQYKGTVMYQANDPKSDFIEHEVCHVYTCSVDAHPNFDPAYAYDLKAYSLETITNQTNSLYSRLAPWVKEMIKKGMV